MARAGPEAPRLPLVPWADLVFVRHLGAGAFGDVALMTWPHRGLTVAVKCNGLDTANGAAIDNEQRLNELLKDNPHDNILPVYGLCVDATDGKVRLVMRFCEFGSLDRYLIERARPEVGWLWLRVQILSGWRLGVRAGVGGLCVRL
jgi:serine/threonine protein kinase